MILEIILIILCPAAAIYITWFLFGAKTHQPLTPEEVTLQWEVHKQRTGCNTKRPPTMIKINNKIVGFKCKCGYEYNQKRLITQRILKHKMEATQCS
jgi:hypothetical protein